MEHERDQLPHGELLGFGSAIGRRSCRAEFIGAGQALGAACLVNPSATAAPTR
jgi:hypothetical protein